MNRKEAEDFIYESYLKAQQYWNYDTPDSSKRSPELTKDILTQLSHTPAVVITGSKGKGSVAAMISRILEAKQKIGLFTNPHISNFCERFRVNGQIIPESVFISKIEELKPLFDSIDAHLPKGKCISPIGIQVALALKWFNQINTDFNIFECGKGARYDDVNNISHSYSVINTIFLEHTRELGKTLKEIATDKSYVIPGTRRCVFVGKQDEGVQQIILEKARAFNVNLKMYGRDFWCENIKFSRQGMSFEVIIGKKTYKDIHIPLLGTHQAYNCSLAMALCEDYLGYLDIHSLTTQLNGLVWRGRMEILCNDPFILLDACINSQSAKEIKKVLNYLKINNITLIVGIPDDKDYEGVVNTMKELSSRIIITKSHNPHYRFTSKQIETLNKTGIPTTYINDIKEAIEYSKSLKKPIVILGTTSLISEVSSYFDLH